MESPPNSREGGAFPETPTVISLAVGELQNFVDSKR
jgi:hypothetical protein